MDSELNAVAAVVMSRGKRATEKMVAEILRSTIDQLLDGQHSGRYLWSTLFKTEKTHAGTLVEINIQRAFRFSDGELLDFEIAGVEVDCKFSQDPHGWMFPPEAVGHLCLVVWASDSLGVWSLGLLRANTEYLNPGKNRDSKRTLMAEKRSAISWLFHNRPLPPNVYLKLTEQQVKDILSQRSGQRRVNRLFVHARKMIVGRGAVATAAQQDDFMKRVRENGGARTALRPLGIAIFGHEHRRIAKALGLPVPEKGELVSAQLTRAPPNSPRAAEIAGGWWRVSSGRTADPILEPAPILPRSRPQREESRRP